MKKEDANECLFCKIYKERIDVIYENKYWYAQFDKFPISPGHTEIIPLYHVVSLDNLRVPEWVHLFHAIGAVVKIIKKTDLEKVYKRFLKNPLNKSSQSLCEQMLGHIGIDKETAEYNWGGNEGRSAGRTIDHLHVHIIPRYYGDVDNPRGGIRNIIPGKGDY